MGISAFSVFCFECSVQMKNITVDTRIVTSIGLRFSSVCAMLADLHVHCLQLTIRSQKEPNMQESSSVLFCSKFLVFRVPKWCTEHTL